MKLKYKYITLLFFSFFISYIECEEEISDIFNVIYKKINLLPYGSTIFFAKNGKCTKDDNTPLFCLINNSIYKVEENNQSFVFNISEYNDDIYYEFNILNNDYNNVTCILSFISNNEIYFQYYIINEGNIILHQIFNQKLTQLSINKNINCQKESNIISSNFICFYIGQNRKLYQIRFNINYGFSINQFEEEKLKDDDLNLNNSFIILSILKNQPKYFLCLNSSRDIIKIYTKQNFPPQSFGRRLNNKPTGEVNNKFNEFKFKCNIKESLLIFSILDNKNKDNNNNNCLGNYANENIGEYNFFFDKEGSLSLSRYDNINCLNEIGLPNQKQIFFIKQINETIETSIETTIINKQTNKINNILMIFLVKKRKVRKY